MPLFDLLNSPAGAAKNLSDWSFSHAADHLEILQAIQKQKGVALTQYLLDPLNEHDLNQWLDRHQQAHDDFNTVLNLDGVDLQSVDLTNPSERESWTLLNFTEHRSARLALGI